MLADRNHDDSERYRILSDAERKSLPRPPKVIDMSAATTVAERSRRRIGGKRALGKIRTLDLWLRT